MTMVKIRMKLKAESDEAYSKFYEELEAVCLEQARFVDALEYSMAVAESMDPAQE